jgi:hypothetical protein
MPHENLAHSALPRHYWVLEEELQPKIERDTPLELGFLVMGW